MNLLFLLFLILTSISCTEKAKENFLTGVKFDESQIKVTDFYKDEKYKNFTNIGIALKSDQNSLLHIKTINKIDTEAAKKLISQRQNEIKTMFAPQLVPYAGQITADINCTQAVEINQTISVTKDEIHLLINLTATDRLIYGSCITDQEVYRSQLLLLFCKSSQTYHEIKYFFDKQIPFKTQIAHCL